MWGAVWEACRTPVPCGPRGESPKGQSVPSLRFPLLLSLPPSLPSCYIPPASLPVSARVPGLRADCMPRLHAHGRSGDNTEAE